MRFWLILTAAFVLTGFPPLNAEELRLPAGTPVFGELSPEAEPLFWLPQDCSVETAGKPVRLWFSQHPLTQCADYFEITLEGKKVYVSPDLQMDLSCKPPRLQVNKGIPLPGQLLLPGSLGILLLLLFQLYRKPETRKQWGYYAAIAVLARTALLSYVVGSSNSIFCNPADEFGYFQVGYDVLQGSFTGPWRYTVGHGVLTMLPAIVLSGAKSYWDLVIPLSWIGGFLLGPLALVLGFRILLALKVPLKAAFCAVLAWAVLPFFLHHAPDWPNLIFRGFAGWPWPGPSFRYYMELIGAGFNGMSDVSSTVLVFLTLYLALRLPASWKALAVVSALFGVSCLVRLNNVFFAPVLGWLLYEKYRPELRSCRSLLRFLGIGSAAYLLVVGIQFAVNFHQFGSPWIWPYSLHALDFPPESRPDAGFTWTTLLKLANLRYLLESNLAVMSCGIAGLLLMTDRKLRIVLSLWAIPVILFFCGYSHTFCDPVRFILSAFLPLLAAPALLLTASWKRRIAGAVLAAGLILLHSGVLLCILLFLLLLRALADAGLELRTDLWQGNSSSPR